MRARVGLDQRGLPVDVLAAISRERHTLGALLKGAIGSSIAFCCFLILSPIVASCFLVGVLVLWLSSASTLRLISLAQKSQWEKLCNVRIFASGGSLRSRSVFIKFESGERKLLTRGLRPVMLSSYEGPVLAGRSAGRTLVLVPGSRPLYRVVNDPIPWLHPAGTR